MTDIRYWIWLGASLGYGSPALLPLLECFGDAEGVFNASDMALSEIKALCAAERKKLSLHDLSRAEEVADYCMHAGVRVLTVADEEYPQALLAIPNPPAVLYVRGTVPAWNTLPCIGVVGARSMSYYGASAACEISYDLARMGCITVSGMALGIDGVVAAASLEAGGKTVAVLGSGIDRLYPKEHKELYRRILEGGGVVVTEFPPYEGADAFHFPLRNRIISGISKALILVEGEANSGSLITARYAKKQGKCVFAVPGKINDKNSEAPLLLLKSDARVLTCADDIYDSFKEEYFASINPFALLPKTNVSVETVLRKYGVASGRDKPKEKKLLAKNTPHEEKSPLMERIRGFFGGAAKTEQDALPEKMCDAKSDDPTERRQMLDQTRRQLLGDAEYALYEKLSYDDPKHPDELTDERGVGEVASMLVMMEITGCVTLVSGGCYIKNEN
ncbi:MAG: DNA-protecting protein DprA [Ruminococcaceae bacterium]|nr:DNA-protecting protein DprA [Oscillospiraceae bacterium]